MSAFWTGKYECQNCHKRIKLYGPKQICVHCGELTELNKYVTIITLKSLHKLIDRYGWVVLTSLKGEIKTIICRIDSRNEHIFTTLIKELDPRALIIIGEKHESIV